MLPRTAFPPVLGLVLAGGDSRRMGEPKALLEVDGLALAARVARALVDGGAERAVLVGGDAGWGPALGLASVADRWPGEGPLAGLAGALGLATTGVVVVAACDQVGLSGRLVQQLVEALAGAPDEVVAVAPRTPDGRRHPLPAAWRATAGPALVALVEGGARRADAAFGIGPVLDLAVADEALIDLDTPDDLARWEQRDRIVPE